MKMMRFSLILMIALLSTTSLSAQSWKKMAKEAGKLMKSGNYLEAGDLYMDAWKAKPKKQNLAYNAGEAYYLVKDYSKAAKAYQVVKDNNKDYNKVGFKYARCLKAMEEYDEASREFVYFINAYKGKDYDQVAQLTQTEILGCEMAIKNADVSNDNITVSHLDQNINSEKMEYAPLAYSDDILYFSSDRDDASKIYRSQFLDGAWTQSQATEAIFTDLEKEHYGNVSFAPDNSRFYFTQCTVTPEKGSVCGIYMVASQPDGNWSAPVALPEYINDPKSTNTHPNVIHKDGLEIIYFTSSRAGGKGGMDIWFTTRDLNSTELDFTFPKNLGATVNTPGNDVTPFYDNNTQTLYFSSNGHIGYGGYDVYRATGNGLEWETPINMEKPINSAQDDRYFVFNTSPNRGFLVSNRKDGLNKISTTDEDIFQFGDGAEELVIRGKIMNQDGDAVSDVKLSLYEVAANGQKRIITQQTANKRFKFPLIENKAYILKATKAGFDAVNMEFEIPTDAESIQKDITLKSDNSVADTGLSTAPSTPKVNAPKIAPTTPSVTTPEVATTTATAGGGRPRVSSTPSVNTKPSKVTATEKPSVSTPSVATTTPSVSTTVTKPSTSAPKATTTTPSVASTKPSTPSVSSSTVTKPSTVTRPSTTTSTVATTTPSVTSTRPTTSVSSTVSRPSTTTTTSTYKPSTTTSRPTTTTSTYRPSTTTTSSTYRPTTSTTTSSYPSTTTTSRPSYTTSTPSRTYTSSTTTSSYPSSRPSRNYNSKPSATDRSWYPNHSSNQSNSASHSSSSSSYTTASSSSSTDYNATTAYQSGTYYKVQMEAMKRYKSAKYSAVSNLGTVEIEGIPSKSLVRILLGNFYSKEDAIKARNAVRTQGYDRAYIVKYQDGQRKAIKVFYNE